MTDNIIPMLYVDATSNSLYPLRILQAYRQNCNLWWATSSVETSNGEDNPLIKAMNDTQRKRAKILDEAIKILEKELHYD